MADYEVKQGDCIGSVAADLGYYWKTIWNNNSELKALRKNPNALLPGDILHIPDKQSREVDCATDKRHKFLLNGEQAKLKLLLERFHRPLANQKYTLVIEGVLHSGTTDDRGYLEVPLRPDARKGKLKVPDAQIECDLNLGYIDPLDEVSGAQSRLQNLGYLTGEISGVVDQATRDALSMFQSTFDLTVSGELDEATKAKLRERHDSHHEELPEAPPAATSASSDDSDTTPVLTPDESSDAIEFASDHAAEED